MDVKTTAPELARDSEAALIGSVLINPFVLQADPITKVGPGHFFIVRHRWVFRAMQHLAADERSIDLLTVAEELDRQGHLEEVGGRAYLTSLVNLVPSATHVEEYARLVLHHAESRSLQEMANNLLKLAHSPNGSSRWAEAQGIFDRYVEDTPSPAGGLLTYEKLQALQWNDDPQIVPDLIPSSGMSSITGETGAGKTFAALDTHMAVAEAGRCFGGRRVTKGGPTLYLGIDNSTRTLQKRARELAIGRGIDPNVEGFYLYQDPIDLTSDEGAAILRRLILETEAILTTIDLLNRYTGRADLNQMTEIGPPLMRLRRIADETGCSILLLHRLNARGRPYGSVDIKGSVDSAMELTLRNVAGTPIRTLRHTKHRDTETVQAMTFSVVPAENGGITLVYETNEGTGDVSDVVEATAQALYDILQAQAGEWLRRRDLNDSMGSNAPGRRQFQRACSTLPKLEGVEVKRQGNAFAYCFNGK